jgi:hypothetical protein
MLRTSDLITVVDKEVDPVTSIRLCAYVIKRVPIPVAARSTAWFCGRSLAGIAVSFPAVSMDSSLLRSVVCCRRSLQRANHSFREVLPRVVCLSVIVKPRSWGSPGPLRSSSHGKPLSYIENSHFSRKEFSVTHVWILNKYLKQQQSWFFRPLPQPMKGLDAEVRNFPPSSTEANNVCYLHSSIQRKTYLTQIV